MLKRKLLSLLIPALALGLATPALADNNQATAKTDSQAQTQTAASALLGFEQPSGPVFFFEGQLPKVVTAKDSKVMLSDRVYRDGKTSLEWDFNNGSKLTFNAPFTVKVAEDRASETKPDNFTFWIYADDVKANSELTFNFKVGDKVVKSFPLKVDFSGWRGFAVPYRDIAGDKVTKDFKVTEVDIVAKGEGKVYFDQMFMAAKIDNRWSIPDRSLEFINPSSQVVVNKNWNALYTYDKLVKEHYPSFDFKAKFDYTSGPSASIYQRFDEVNGVNPDLAIDEAKVEALLTDFANFKIQEKDGVFTGPRIEFPTRLDYTKDASADGLNLNEATRKELLDKASYTDLRTLGKKLFEAAKYLRSKNLNDADRKALEAEFVKSIKFVLSQGFTAGASYQIIHHLGYQDREMFNAIFLMRDLIAQAGLLEQVQGMEMWYTGLGRIFEKDIVDANADILNTQLQWMLQSVLLLPNQEQRDALLAQFSDWLSKSLLQSKGVGGGFKADGTVFHHAQHYPLYGNDSLRGLTPTFYVLAGSKFALSHAAEERVKLVLKTMDFYSKDTLFPVALSGRHPTEKFKVLASAYKWAAKATDDKELAAITARLNHQADFEGTAAGKEPRGARALPWSSALVMRGAADAEAKDSWLIVARGYSRYFPGNEAYGGNNRYSRFGMNGKFEIFPSALDDRPYRHDGFDWRFYDGTTALYLPFAKLKSQLNQLPGGGVEEMLLSDQTYSGANTLGSNVGLFAQTVHGHAKYDEDSLWANKSYFVFGNNVVALGSNIQSKVADAPVITTITQTFLKDKAEFKVDGKALADGTKETLEGSAVLTSPAGVTYYVPAKSNLKVTLGEQTTPDDRNDKDTKGKFAVAYLDHGAQVKDGSYEYSMVIEPVKDQGRPHYKVLVQDDNAHVVYAPEFATTAYSLFKAGNVNSKDALLASASAPSLVLIKNEGNKVEASFVNPDMNLYQGVEKDQVTKDGRQQEVISYSREWFFNDSKELTTTYVLNGEFAVDGKAPEGVKVEAANGKTTVTVTANEAKEVKVQFVKK